MFRGCLKHTVQRACFPHEFTCTNGECVLIAFKCDDIDDCGDSSDEDNCGTCRCTWVFPHLNKGHKFPPGVNSTQTICNSLFEFTCDSGECISESYQCDGQNDCGDNSDEQNCGIK